jgi:hypothetical protein
MVLITSRERAESPREALQIYIDLVERDRVGHSYQRLSSKVAGATRERSLMMKVILGQQ